MLEVTGFILDIINYWLVSFQKLAPELLYNHYSEHKILINMIYILGGLVLIGIFSADIYFKVNKRNNYVQFNEVELK